MQDDQSDDANITIIVFDDEADDELEPDEGSGVGSGFVWGVLAALGLGWLC